MDYPAKTAYQNLTEASTYDQKRFRSWKGKLADHLEKNAIARLLEDLAPGSLILDVACGTGRITKFLYEKNYKAWGVDISAEMLETARQNLSVQNGEVKFFQGEAENLPFAPRLFEAVFAIKLLGHVPPEQRIGILRELKRVSRGKVVVSYYYSSILHNFKRRLKKVLKKTCSPWYPVTRRELAREVESAGLKISREIPVARFLSETKILLLEENENLDAG